MEGPAVTVNGETVPLAGATPHTTALDWLRAQGLTGCKEGCAEGECGACSVLVARPGLGTATEWTAVNACLVPVAALDGQELVTAEGLGSPDALHPVQREMAVRGGSQCGYCTPGFVCSMAAEYYRAGPRAGRRRPAGLERGPNGFDLHALSGNLCRCTGYRPIRDAAFALGPPPEGDALARRQTAPPPAVRADPAVGRRQRVRPAGRPGRGARADLAARRTPPSSRAPPTGASRSTCVERAPALVVAVDRLAELRGFAVGDDFRRDRRGAEPDRGRAAPRRAASRCWRRCSRSSPPGSSATAPPSAGTSARRPLSATSRPALLALDATVLLASAGGEREVPLADYFAGYRQTMRRSDELIRAVRIPLPVARVASFHKIAKRRFDDISSVAVGVALDVEDGVVRRARIGLGGVAATPSAPCATEEALEGRPWTQETVRAAADVLAGEGTPLDDHRASAAYRTAMLRHRAAQAARDDHQPAGGAGMSALSDRPRDPVVGLAVPHESAALHVTGAGALHRRPRAADARASCTRTRCRSPHAHARITALDTAPALAVPGRRPGAHRRRRARRQRRRRQARRAAVPRRGDVLRARRLLGARRDARGRPARRRSRSRSTTSRCPSLVTVREAIAAEQLPGRPAHASSAATSRRGFAGAAHVFSGEFEFAGQEHFYLETHCSLAHVDESGQVFVQSSTQHPTETQEIVAHVLGPAEPRRSPCSACGWAAASAARRCSRTGSPRSPRSGATLTGRPVRLRLTRTQDMTMTGKRHGFHAAVAGRLRRRRPAAGARRDPDLRRRLEPRPLRAGAGAGAVPHRQRLLDPQRAGERPDRQDPQDLADRVPRVRRPAGDARHRGHPRPLRAAARASTRSTCAGATSTCEGQAHAVRPAGAPPGAAVGRAGSRCSTTGDVARAPARDRGVQRRARAHQAGAGDHAGEVRHLLQLHRLQPGRRAGARLQGRLGADQPRRHRDGPGPAHEDAPGRGHDARACRCERVRLAPTRTDKVPNTSATAASSGADLNGGAVKDACEQILDRLRAVAAERLGVAPPTCGSTTGTCAAGRRRRAAGLGRPGRAGLLPAGPAVGGRLLPHRGAALGLRGDAGPPFKYFAYGAAATEVEVDGFTGAYRTRRVDIVHDVGDSLSPLVDIGQIEGGFVQGAGWLTLEDLRWDESDRPDPRPARHPGGEHLQAAELLRDARGLQRRAARARARGRRRLRLQGGRRAAADAGLLGARGAAPGGGGVRPGGHQRRPGRPRPRPRRSTGRSSRPRRGGPAHGHVVEGAPGRRARPAGPRRAARCSPSPSSVAARPVERGA